MTFFFLSFSLPSNKPTPTYPLPSRPTIKTMKLSLNAFILSAISAAVLAATPGSDAAAIHPRAPAPSGSGYNDWNCKPLEGRRPVILVHATLFTKESWAIFGPAIAKQGYCVYSVTYGRYWKTLLPMVGAIAPAVDNAKEVGAFAEKVLEATGTLCTAKQTNHHSIFMLTFVVFLLDIILLLC